jgi:hypothetical protein
MALFVTARKVHRYFVIIILLLGLLMAATGISMKYSVGDTGLARYLHNNISVIFTIVLLIMMCTGAYLYAYPAYMRRKQGRQQEKKVE